MKRSIYLLSVAFLMLFIVSCKKTDNPSPVSEDGLENLQIPDGFLFESTKEITVSIILPTSVA
ncbi:MAG: hypothetical protein KJ754_16450, partial [Bacteroidetes bacterium]|nr:hypothetical protein [Bacteroidota bacterium]MBU1581023.1 hypothetical protein [Bacteroidota bacterium]